MDVELGPDGALYVLEWGSQFGGNNADAQLVRVEFVGNPPALPGDYNRNNEVDAADFVLWRQTLGQNGVGPFTGADGNGDSVIDQDDYEVWQANFGKSLQQPAIAIAASAMVDDPQVNSEEHLPVRLSVSAHPGSLQTEPKAAPPGRQSESVPSLDRLRATPPARPAPRASVPINQLDDALLAWLSSMPDMDSVRKPIATHSTSANRHDDSFTQAALDAVFAALDLRADAKI
jgi:hypothetical protein